MPKSRVIDPAFTWGRERAPSVPWDRTIVYETHVGGYTRLHPAVPEHLRGTYAGLGRKEVVDYIKSLGVTSVELLPIHAFVNDSYLLDKGLTNYWGYNSIGFFAPDPRYSAVPDFVFSEFKEMVARLHDAGPGGHSRRRLQPHRRGQRTRPDAVVPRHRQPVLLPADP